jgi:hypothetical protein
VIGKPASATRSLTFLLTITWHSEIKATVLRFDSLLDPVDISPLINVD